MHIQFIVFRSHITNIIQANLCVVRIVLKIQIDRCQSL